MLGCQPVWIDGWTAGVWFVGCGSKVVSSLASRKRVGEVTWCAHRARSVDGWALCSWLWGHLQHSLPNNCIHSTLVQTNVENSLSRHQPVQGSFPRSNMFNVRKQQHPIGARKRSIQALWEFKLAPSDTSYLKIDTLGRSSKRFRQYIISWIIHGMFVSRRTWIYSLDTAKMWIEKEYQIVWSIALSENYPFSQQVDGKNCYNCSVQLAIMR